MARRSATTDSVAITGCAIGVLSLGVGWLTLKSSRIAAGTGLRVWDSFGWGPATLIMGLWLLCLVLSFAGTRRRNVIALGLALNALIFAVFLFSGVSASRLLEGLSTPARASLGIGIWTTAIGAYIGIFACRQRLGDSPVWRGIISWSGLTAVIVLLGVGWLSNLSVMVEFRQQQAQFVRQFWNHIILFASSVAAGTLIGIPLGIWATRSRTAERPVFFVTNVVQTVPSLALFGLLIAPLSALSFAFPVLRQWGISGIGTAPAIIALVLYSLLPVTRNTYVGLKKVDPAVIDAGLGMGMSRSCIFRRIEVPLSAPLVLEGIRTSSVQTVGNTAVAALIGAGGLGWFIFQGISQAANDVVILGALPIMGLALSVDIVMRRLVKAATPKALRLP